MIMKYIEARKFVYAEMHGNLKMMFNDNEKVVRKFVHAFNLKMELAKMIARVNHEDPK